VLYEIHQTCHVWKSISHSPNSHEIIRWQIHSTFHCTFHSCHDIFHSVSEWKYYEISWHNEYELHPLYFHFTGKAMSFPSDFQLPELPGTPSIACTAFDGVAERRAAMLAALREAARCGEHFSGLVDEVRGRAGGSGLGSGSSKNGENHGKNVKTREN
jgi:hypothetical protein